MYFRTTIVDSINPADGTPQKRCLIFDATTGELEFTGSCETAATGLRKAIRRQMATMALYTVMAVAFMGMAIFFATQPVVPVWASVGFLVVNGVFDVFVGAALLEEDSFLRSLKEVHSKVTRD